MSIFCQKFYVLVTIIRKLEKINQFWYNINIIIVTHSMQQAKRISNKTAFFLLGEVIEFDETEKLFSNPSDERTDAYINGETRYRKIYKNAWR